MSSTGPDLAQSAAESPAADQLRRRSRRDAMMQRYLLAVAVVACLGFLVVFYLPSLKRTESTAREIASAALKLDADANRASRLPQMKAAVTRLRTQLAAFQPIPEVPGQAEFVRSMAEAAEGLELNDLRFEPLAATADDASGLRRTPIRIEFASDFAVAHELIERIERLPRLLSVTALNVKPVAGTDAVDADLVRTEITVTLFHRTGA